MGKKKKTNAAMSKVEYVRQALKAIGKDATAAQVGEHIKGKHGDSVAAGITGSMLANYVTMQKKQLFGGGKKRRKKPGAPAAPAATPVSTKITIEMGDLRSLGSMVGKYGVNGIKQMAELMGK